ncbi:MAG: hypothetical protein RLZZ118_754 [Bacteroidota bacterium]|jgi:hypothetical protein
MRKIGICIGVVVLFIASCTKGPGPGGRAKIKGKLFAKNLDKTLSFVTDSGFVADEKIYISYGDNTSVGNDVTTSFDGSFEFDYLRPGNYKVWAISKILYGVNQLDTTIVQDVTISGKSEEKDLGTIRIYTNKN